MQRSIGKYRIIAQLGHGGMGDVYLAVAEGPTGAGFSKLTVVKHLRPHLAEDPDLVAMLMDEARVTARLNHPNIVALHEVAVEGHDYFLALEYLDGQPLRRITQRLAKAKKTLPPELGYLIVASTLAGLHHAHDAHDYDGTSLNIVHRDVTPHNVFVTYTGDVKIVDFGIAKAERRIADTREGIVKGKVRYMAPEQLLGCEVDRRADIFAVGVMLFELATGVRFWGDRDEREVAAALVGGEYERSPQKVNPAVPEEIDRICRRALAHDRANRYATAAEMQDELDSFLGGWAFSGQRMLATLTSDLFVRERAKLRELIEVAMRDTHDISMPVILSASRPRAAEPPSLAAMAIPTPSSIESGLADVLEGPTKHLAVRPPKRRFGSVLVVASMLTAIAGFGTTQLRGGAPTTRTPSMVSSDVATLVKASDRMTRAPRRGANEVAPRARVPAARIVPRPATPPPTTKPLPESRGSVPTNAPKLDASDPWR